MVAAVVVVDLIQGETKLVNFMPSSYPYYHTCSGFINFECFSELNVCESIKL